MKATSSVLLASQGDDYFRPVDVCVAPDGSLLVADWYDGGVGGHAYNDLERGRIYRLTPAGTNVANPTRSQTPRPDASTADAIEALQSPNLATQYLARERLFVDGEKSVPALKALLADADPNHVARALWMLDRIGGAGLDEVLLKLKSEDYSLRALAVRILRRRRSADGGLTHADAILKLADDESFEVVREVLIALQGVAGEPAAAALLKISRRYDGGDRYLLEAINLAAGTHREKLYEQLVADGPPDVARFPLFHLLNPQAASEWLATVLDDPSLDGSTQLALLAAADRLKGIDAGLCLVKMLCSSQQTATLQRSFLECISTNLGGPWQELANRPELTAMIEFQLTNPQLQRDVLAIIRKHHLKSVSHQVLKVAEDASGQASAPVRGEALETLAAVNAVKLKENIRQLRNDPVHEVRMAALNALADLQDVQTIHEALLGETFVESRRAQLVDRIMQTTSGALLILKLIKEGKLAETLKQQIVAQAAAHPDANVRFLYAELIPEADRPQRLGEVIHADDVLRLTGDAARGERIFARSSSAQCRNCHSVDGVGSNLGPDLSTIGKKYERSSFCNRFLTPAELLLPSIMFTHWRPMTVCFTRVFWQKKTTRKSC